MPIGSAIAATEQVEDAQANVDDRQFELGETVYRSCDSCHSLYWVGDADKGR